MHSSLKLCFRCICFIVVSAFTVASAPGGETAGSAATVVHTSEQKALLKALDDQLARFDVLFARDKNATHVATVKANLEALKQRCDTFKKVAFDQGKYDELRFDLNVVYQRLNLWLAPPIAPKAAPNARAADSSKTRS